MLDLRAKKLRRDLDDLECVETVNLRNRWTPHSNKLQLLAVVHAGEISKKEGATPCYGTGAQTIDQIVISALNSEWAQSDAILSDGGCTFPQTLTVPLRLVHEQRTTE